jgi:hypothetical protein
LMMMEQFKEEEQSVEVLFWYILHFNFFLNFFLHF